VTFVFIFQPGPVPFSYPALPKSPGRHRNSFEPDFHRLQGLGSISGPTNELSFLPRPQTNPLSPLQAFCTCPFFLPELALVFYATEASLSSLLPSLFPPKRETDMTRLLGFLLHFLYAFTINLPISCKLSPRIIVPLPGSTKRGFAPVMSSLRFCPNQPLSCPFSFHRYPVSHGHKLSP